MSTKPHKASYPENHHFVPENFRIWSGYGQDVVEKAIEMPLARMRWGDEEMGQRWSQEKSRSEIHEEWMKHSSIDLTWSDDMIWWHVYIYTPNKDIETHIEIYWWLMMIMIIIQMQWWLMIISKLYPTCVWIIMCSKVARRIRKL